MIRGGGRLQHRHRCRRPRCRSMMSITSCTKPFVTHDDSSGFQVSHHPESYFWQWWLDRLTEIAQSFRSICKLHDHACSAGFFGVFQNVGSFWREGMWELVVVILEIIYLCVAPVDRLLLKQFWACALPLPVFTKRASGSRTMRQSFYFVIRTQQHNLPLFRLRC